VGFVILSEVEGSFQQRASTPLSLTLGIWNLKIGYFQKLFPAIRFNILCRTPAQNDFHFYQG
jgi:hypothetical protein